MKHSGSTKDRRKISRTEAYVVAYPSSTIDARCSSRTHYFANGDTRYKLLATLSNPFPLVPVRRFRFSHGRNFDRRRSNAGAVKMIYTHRGIRHGDSRGGTLRTEPQNYTRYSSSHIARRDIDFTRSVIEYIFYPLGIFAAQEDKNI